jgi:hypothetical protein
MQMYREVESTFSPIYSLSIAMNLDKKGEKKRELHARIFHLFTFITAPAFRGSLMMIAIHQC